MATLPQTGNARAAAFNPPSDNIENSLHEQLGTPLPELDIELEDAELAANITEAISSGMPLHNELKPIQDLNERYYLGDQLDPEMTLSARRKVRVIENRQFISGETMIPIVTTEIPEPIVFAQPQHAEFARALEKVLMGTYRTQETDIVMSIGVRHWMNYRLGCLKLVVNEETGMWKTIFVRPQRLVIGTTGTTETEVPFIAELVESTIGDMCERFPEKEDAIYAYFTGLLNGDTPADSTPAYYWEFWTNEMVAMKLGTELILEKSKNFLWDWENKANNFIAEPSKPYFFINRVFTLGRTAYDDTSMIEQAKTIQDGINKTHWGIMADLSDRGAVVGSGEAISKEELAKYRGEEGEKIWIEKGRPADAIQRFQPKVVTAAALAYQQRLADRSDDIWGTHSTTRGERQGSETASGRIMLKQHDERRTAPVERVLRSAAQKLFSMQVQVIKLFWDEEQEVPYIDGKGMTELVKFSAENVPPKSSLQVKEGSMLPKDKMAQREEALELRNKNSIDDETLFERLGWDKPQEAAKRLYLWKQVDKGALPPDVLYPGIGQEIQQATAAATPAPPAPGEAPPAGAPPAAPGGAPDLAALLGDTFSAAGGAPPADDLEAALAGGGQ